MTLPNILTFSRLLATPLFYGLFSLLSRSEGTLTLGINGLLWILFLASEVTDLLDGFVARRWNLVSDLGKVMDPFSDAVVHVTYFFAFTSVGLMPRWVFLVILWREFGVLFLRLLAAQKGVALAARRGGKLKTVFYALASTLGLVVVTGDAVRYPLPQGTHHVLTILFILAAAAALLSLGEYLLSWLRRARKQHL